MKKKFLHDYDAAQARIDRGDPIGRTLVDMNIPVGSFRGWQARRNRGIATKPKRSYIKKHKITTLAVTATPPNHSRIISLLEIALELLKGAL